MAPRAKPICVRSPSLSQLIPKFSTMSTLKGLRLGAYVYCIAELSTPLLKVMSPIEFKLEIVSRL